MEGNAPTRGRRLLPVVGAVPACLWEGGDMKVAWPAWPAIASAGAW